MSIPPEYALIHQELQKVIENPPSLSHDVKKSSLDSLSKRVSSPEAEAALINEIDALAGAALEADTIFDTTAALFKKMQIGASPELAHDVVNLQGAWARHHDTFTNLLYESRIVAGKAQAASDDFAKDFITFLADDDTPVSEKKEEIKNYLEKLSRDQESSQSMAQDFIDLKNNMEASQTQWMTIVKKYGIDTAPQRVVELDRIIADLDMTLADLNNKIRALVVALDVLPAAGGISAVLGSICPTFWIDALLKIVGVSVTAELLKKAVDERDDIEGKLAVNKAERAKLVATLPTAQELTAALSLSVKDFDVICARIGAFGHIWATIRVNLHAIEVILTTHNPEDSLSMALFKARLNAIAKLYAALSKGLRRYQTAVNKDN